MIAPHFPPIKICVFILLAKVYTYKVKHFTPFVFLLKFSLVVEIFNFLPAINKYNLNIKISIAYFYQTLPFWCLLQYLKF